VVGVIDGMQETHWILLFFRATQDWEMDMLTEFLNLIYSTKIERDATARDNMC
jgi:hypothetical protein